MYSGGMPTDSTDNPTEDLSAGAWDMDLECLNLELHVEKGIVKANIYGNAMWSSRGLNVLLETVFFVCNYTAQQWPRHSRMYGVMW